MEKYKCLLSGATGGIGQAIARLLDQQGHQLILQGRNLEKLSALQASLTGEHEIAVGDLTQADDVNKIIKQTNQGKPLTLLINNAGISQFGNFFEHRTDEIRQLININLTAPMLLTHALLPQLKKSNSVIINVGSALGSIGFPCFSSYCASKFGLKGFTESLSRELKQSSIRVCYFAPRTTSTAINSDNVVAMNKALGNTSDNPDDVAKQLHQLLTSNSTRASVGWPEKFFARLNGCLPELVDQAMSKKLAIVQKFSQTIATKKSVAQQTPTNQLAK
jgi:short-subunit dehydrogenase